MITGSGLEAADDAAPMVAEARDDPAGRIRLAADTYAFGRVGSAVSALPAGGRRVHALAAGTGCPQSAGRRYPRQPVVARSQ